MNKRGIPLILKQRVHKIRITFEDPPPQRNLITFQSQTPMKYVLCHKRTILCTFV